ncbi:MAG: SH3 domain-containing protein [Bdellovibrionales bacterium]|nr:SH3 domain-containing protein [Bdellovibrionales bacterium]
MTFRIFIFLISFVVFYSPLGEGKDRQWQEYVLSYKQLKRLSPKARYTYLRQLAKALAQLDQKKNARNLPLFNWIDEAYADGQKLKCIGGGAPVTAESSHCGSNSYAGFSCADSSKDICNPLIFGLQSNGEPYCHKTATTYWCYKNIKVTSESLDAVFNKTSPKYWEALKTQLDTTCNDPSTIEEPEYLVRDACRIMQEQIKVNERRNSNYANYRNTKSTAAMTDKKTTSTPSSTSKEETGATAETEAVDESKREFQGPPIPPGYTPPKEKLNQTAEKQAPSPQPDKTPDKVSEIKEVDGTLIQGTVEIPKIGQTIKACKIPKGTLGAVRDQRNENGQSYVLMEFTNADWKKFCNFLVGTDGKKQLWLTDPTQKTKSPIIDTKKTPSYELLHLAGQRFSTNEEVEATTDNAIGYYGAKGEKQCVIPKGAKGQVVSHIGNTDLTAYTVRYASGVLNCPGLKNNELVVNTIPLLNQFPLKSTSTYSIGSGALQNASGGVSDSRTQSTTTDTPQNIASQDTKNPERTPQQEPRFRFNSTDGNTAPLRTGTQEKLSYGEVPLYKPNVENHLNLRDQPQGAKIGVLKPTDRVTLLETQGNWKKVGIPGTQTTGWVYDNDGDKDFLVDSAETHSLSLDSSAYDNFSDEGTYNSPIQDRGKIDLASERTIRGLTKFVGSVYQSCGPMLNSNIAARRAQEISFGKESGRTNPRMCVDRRGSRNINYAFVGMQLRRNRGAIEVDSFARTDCNGALSSILAGAGLRYFQNNDKALYLTTQGLYEASKRKDFCMFNPILTKQYSLQPGDLINTSSNHSVMVYKVGPDPLGLNKIKSRKQCNQISRHNFDFTVFHSSNRKYNGERRNGPHFIEAKKLNSLAINHLALAVRRFCKDNFPDLNGQLSSRTSYGRGQQSSKSYFSLFRHVGDKKPGCIKPQPTPVRGEQCLEEKCYEDTLDYVFPNTQSTIQSPDSGERTGTK